MATLRIPEEDRTIREPKDVAHYLGGIGIRFERWEASRPLGPSATADEVLAAYATEIDRLKAQGGYVTADVIDVHPQTPNLEAMLAKFEREHWHDEDEVRFIVEGSGIFFIHPRGAPVVSIEVRAGDLLSVPRGTWHWFTLCPEKRIRAIRLFQDPSGWSPHYTESGTERGFEPVCLGPMHVAPAT